MWPACVSTGCGGLCTPARGAAGATVSARATGFRAPPREKVLCRASLKKLRDRLTTVKSTQKITEAMKLVAAAKVRSAQDAVLNGRPFTEELVKVLYELNLRVGLEELEVPLCDIRPVNNVLLVVFTSDRGLCGSYNNKVIKAALRRHNELKNTGVGVKFILVGKKGIGYFTSPARPETYDIATELKMASKPTDVEAGVISDDIVKQYTEKTVDKVELVYSKFESLQSTTPIVQTLLPLASPGIVRSAVDGVSLDTADDEVFKLTSSGGKFAVKRESVEVDTSGVDSALEAVLVFDADPNQILDTLMPLYLNGLILKSLQEALASELASRMQAMSQANDNAKDLYDKVSKVYNRTRQSKITTELIEIIAGSAAVQ